MIQHAVSNHKFWLIRNVRRFVNNIQDYGYLIFENQTIFRQKSSRFGMMIITYNILLECKMT